ncbi:GNAT family N-acetyltransferase [Planococcus ruber]|uniref:GNAT family N-acetyltransferase n=1 Tax=Planococcus ruber TaxID=2027871 RepID=UPI001FED450D|nr:GNAT family N-acetyltransferase [Planococcus ruber]MCJ1909531.1 GNAT family N-acetyltransferase [Planococcus ruber]
MIQFMGVEDRHVRQMAVLLAKRQERERKRFSFLKAAFEEIDETEVILRTLLDRPYVSGIVAVRGIDVIGYLLYEFKESAERGRYVFIDYASMAISENEHPRLLRLLYADVGAEWVKHGYFHHVLMAPLGQPLLVEEMLDQGFRYEQKYAVLPLKDFTPAESGREPGLEFRKGTPADGPLLKKMAAWNSIHQATAPSWNPITKETLDDIKQSYSEVPDDEEALFWLAEQSGRIAGFHIYYRKEDPQNLAVPSNCAELPAASTNPEMRGKGIGRALATYCFGEIKKMGFDYIYTDWHTPNHLSSYFWPRMGFEPVMVRMSRQIDPRIAWAHGQE